MSRFHLGLLPTWCWLLASAGVFAAERLPSAMESDPAFPPRTTIHTAPDMARYAMNNFIISVACYVKPLTEYARKAAEKIGPVHANLGDNSCEIPFAPDYIKKVEARHPLGKKRKTMKC